MFKTAAPYLVTVLVSLGTWMLTTYWQALDESVFVEIAQERDGDRLTFEITNHSRKYLVNNLVVTFRCLSSQEPCFATGKWNGSSGHAVPEHVPPWAVLFQLNASKLAVKNVLTLPSGASMLVHVWPLPGKQVLHVVSNQKIDQLRIVESGDWDLFVYNNYVWIISLTIAIAVLFILIALPMRTKPPTEETINVRIVDEE